MKIVAAVFADFVEAATGGPAQLGADLAGQPVLARTLRRLTQVAGVTGRCLFVRPRDREPAAQVLRQASVADQFDLVAEDTGVRTRRQLIRAARKWNLDSWRGGLLAMTWFDEFVDPPAVAAVLNHYKCDGVFCLDGHQAVFDPHLATAMLAHLDDHQHECKVVFTQAPPGLAGVIIRREALENLLELAIPFGLLLSYRPELAQPDPIIQSACYHVPEQVGQMAARFIPDTRRSRELLDLALRELGEEVSADALCHWAGAPGHDRAGPLPVEVELELTTDDPLPLTTLRPRGDRVPRRQIGDLTAIARLAEQLGEYDDRLVFLGGHGDPLRHPRFADVCRLLRAGGVYGIGVGTPLLELTDENFAALLDTEVDVVEVRLDAHTAATYQQVQNLDGFGRVLANIERIERARQEQKRPQPIIVCSLTRCAATLPELEAFFDAWIKTLGSAVIHGYNDYCGTLPADSLLPTTPPIRTPCRRLTTRLMLLANGVVPLCAQDFRGDVRLGDWTTGRMADIWQGVELENVRRAHQQMDLGALPTCVRCTEWFRP